MWAMAPKLWSSVLVWTTSRFKCFSSLRIAFGNLSGEVEASVNYSFDGLCEYKHESDTVRFPSQVCCGLYGTTWCCTRSLSFCCMRGSGWIPIRSLRCAPPSTLRQVSCLTRHTSTLDRLSHARAGGFGLRHVEVPRRFPFFFVFCRGGLTLLLVTSQRRVRRIGGWTRNLQLTLCIFFLSRGGHIFWYVFHRFGRISYLTECTACILGVGWVWRAVRGLFCGVRQNPCLDLVGLRCRGVYILISAWVHDTGELLTSFTLDCSECSRCRVWSFQ